MCARAVVCPEWKRKNFQKISKLARLSVDDKRVGPFRLETQGDLLLEKGRNRSRSAGGRSPCCGC